MKFLKWLWCKHGYEMAMFRAPHRDVLNLLCVHCGQELIFLMAKEK